MIGVVDVSRVGLSHIDVGKGHERAGAEAEIVKNDVVAEHTAPKLHPPLIAVSLGHEGHRHHVFFLVSGLSRHQVEFSRLVG